MRILFDARSVRTPAGRQIFAGLAGGWAHDARVERVIAAVPPGFDAKLVPEGVETSPLGEGGWLRHLLVELPRIADEVRSDVIFSPNATPPRDRRSVIYCQDLKHFRPADPGMLHWQWRAGELGRSAWRRFATSRGLLAVGTSHDIAREVARRIPLPVVTIPNGVDVGERRWSGDRDEVFVMGGVGPWKGEETSLAAWARLTPRQRGGTILVLAGVDPGDRRAELRRRAETLGIVASVAIEGALPRAEFLDRAACARLAVSCSRFEAFGLPVAEALVLGAPVVCSDLPAHRELIERAGAGVTFPTGDERALADLLARALDGSPPPRRREPPAGWSWTDRASEHIDAYASHLAR